MRLLLVNPLVLCHVLKLGPQGERDDDQRGHHVLRAVPKVYDDEVHHRAQHQRRDGEVAANILQAPQEGAVLSPSFPHFTGTRLNHSSPKLQKQITDLKKEGKLVLPGAEGAGGPSTPPTAVNSPAAGGAGAVVSPAPSSKDPSGSLSGNGQLQQAPPSPGKKTGAKGSSSVSEGFMAMLSFREESLGDQIKFALCMVLALYLVINFIRWQLISRKLQGLEDSVRKLEAIAQELLDAKRSSLF